MANLRFSVENFSHEKRLFIAESLALMSLAYIAGSKRFIQYFPGMSRSGLFMTAGLTCLGSSLYEAYQSKDTSSESLWNVMKKTAVVAGAVLMSFGFYKAYIYCSDKKVSLSPDSSVKLGLFQLGGTLPYELWRSIYKQEELHKKKISTQRDDAIVFLRDLFLNHPILIQSIIFMSSAYMAGSKRCVRYFPRASMLGLLAQGSGVSAMNYFYETFEDKRYPELHVLNKVCVLGLAVFYSFVFVNVYSFLTERTLKAGHNVSLSFSSNLKFGLFELAVLGSIHGMVYLNRQMDTPLDEKPVEAKDVSLLSDQDVQQLRREDLVQAIPKEKVDLVDSSVVGFLTEEQLEHLTDPVKQQALPQHRVPFIASFQEVMRFSKGFWPEMQLTQEVLYKLGTGKGEQVAEIFALKDQLDTELAQAFRDFDANSARLPAACEQIKDILINNGPQTGFESGAKGREERQEILYDITHVIFALKKLVDTQPSADVKATVKLLLEGFVNTIANNYCKTGWTSALEQFEGIKGEHCSCCDCDKKDGENHVLLKAKLEQKMALFKKECFTNTVLQAYGGADRQQVHTVEWYARELPHLNVGARFSDLNAGCARTSISARTIEAAFLKKYLEDIPSFVKGLLSFGGGDEEIRELLLDIFKGLFMEEARKAGVNLSKEQASYLVTSSIWDPETFEVNDAFVGVLLYAFHHMHFDPLDERFHQPCPNGQAFSINFDKVAVVLNQFSKGAAMHDGA